MGLNLPNYEILCQQTKQNNCQTKTKNIENACTAIKTYGWRWLNFSTGRWKKNCKQGYVKLSSELKLLNISANKTKCVLQKVKVQISLENALWKLKQEK